MRLHRLEVTAFGPFAGTTAVDFDELSAAGLFLLSGPTGAGKSSVLDAVCFALYGDVPGDRAAAKRLRSDHAAPHVAPRVVLDATLSGRRVRIDRSPAWTRAKKRGTGTTTEQARVVVSERRPLDGRTDSEVDWVPLSTRLDESGHLLTRLVGMTLGQFCQVALLPQGRFQEFLRARSEDRHALLQQVFRTERFDRTERWLRDRRVELRRSSERHRESVADLVSRVSEVAVTEPPAGWHEVPDSLDPWIADLAARTERDAEAQAIAVGDATAAEAHAAQTEAAAIELAGLRATHAAARRDRAALAAASADHAARRDRLDRAERALPVQPLHAAAERDRAEAERLSVRAQDVLDDLAAHLGLVVLDASEVADHHRTATGVLTDVGRVRPLQARASALAVDHARVEAERERVAEQVAEVDVRVTEVPALLAALAPSLAGAREAAGEVETLGSRLELVRARVRAARSVDTLEAEHAAALTALEAATGERLEARERLVEIRERRLDGMAAEIAARLVVGGCCPVCGSAEHPQPATPAPGAPDDAAERSARRLVDDLEVVVEAHAQQVRAVESRLAAARVEAGGTLEEVLVVEAGLVADLDAARATAATGTALAEQVAALEREGDELAERRAALADRLAVLDTDLAALAARAATLREQVAAVLGPATDLEALEAHHRRTEQLAARHAEVADDLARAEASAASTHQAAEDAAARAGFASPAEAAQAWLPAAEVEALATAVRAHEREQARLEEVLADETLLRAAAAAAPDLEGLARAHHETRDRATAARRAEAVLRERSERLRALSAQVSAALDAWRPVAADLDLVADLASLVEGKHPDNRWQMRLSAYVLSHRLGQVVDAANLRLATMSDQRYALVHTGRRGAGERRGGLGLLVHDAWTDDTRDPATLSGGETFVVSLALALGLADVITDEAGGADLDTLFVDEGFGSLDAETLEDVMDTLDTLRDGGRVVGVVSHVPELQTRIPTQLRIHRGRTGSHATLETG